MLIGLKLDKNSCILGIAHPIAKMNHNRQKKQREFPIVLVLIILFMAVLGARLFLALQTSEFSDDQSYFALRQIEAIKETKHPLYNDSLSYGGKLNIFLPLYYYTIAFFSYFMPIKLALIIIPNIFASFSLIIFYLLFFRLTGKKSYSLIAALVSSFIPVFFSETIKNVSVNSVLIPLLCFAIYCFLNVGRERYAIYYIISIVLMSLLSSTIFILIISFFVYLLLLRLERMKQDKKELELIFFTAFFAIWVSLLFFKKALLFHGVGFFLQNLPEQIFASFFSDITIPELVYKIGVLPLLAGILMIYSTIMSKNRGHLLIVSLSITTALMLWFKVIPLNLGMVFLGIFLSLFFAEFLKKSFSYLERTKIAGFRWFFYLLLAVFVAFTLIAPSISYSKSSIENIPKKNLIRALDWLSYNSEENATITSILDDGNKISYFSKRRNIMDSNFLLADDTSQRYKDIETIYTTKSEVEAIRLMNKYSSNYLLFSPAIKSKFKVKELDYVSDQDCFQLLYDKQLQVYKLTCKI